MYAECINGVSDQMANDKQVDIISDTGVFIITPSNNIGNYPDLEWEEADEQAVNAYKDQIINN